VEIARGGIAKPAGPKSRGPTDPRPATFAVRCGSTSRSSGSGRSKKAAFPPHIAAVGALTKHVLHSGASAAEFHRLPVRRQSPAGWIAARGYFDDNTNLQRMCNLYWGDRQGLAWPESLAMDQIGTEARRHKGTEGDELREVVRGEIETRKRDRDFFLPLRASVPSCLYCRT
jgi:hypothetical protein